METFPQVMSILEGISAHTRGSIDLSRVPFNSLKFKHSSLVELVAHQFSLYNLFRVLEDLGSTDGKGSENMWMKYSYSLRNLLEGYQ